MWVLPSSIIRITVVVVHKHHQSEKGTVEQPTNIDSVHWFLSWDTTRQKQWSLEGEAPFTGSPLPHPSCTMFVHISSFLASYIIDLLCSVCDSRLLSIHLPIEKPTSLKDTAIVWNPCNCCDHIDWSASSALGFLHFFPGVYTNQIST